MRRSGFLVTAVLVVVVAAHGFCGAAPEGPQEIVVEEAITYRVATGQDLMMDIARPEKSRVRLPAIVFFVVKKQGSATVGSTASRDRSTFRLHIRMAAKKGYVGIAAECRTLAIYGTTAGQVTYPYPAQVEDAVQAVRWLRENASKHRIDPRRIGVFGHYDGALCALMVALMDKDDIAGIDGDFGDSRHPSRVQAVVVDAAPVDLLLPSGVSDVPWADYLQGPPEDIPERYREASPVTYVTSDDPPVMSIWRRSNHSIIPGHREELDARLKEMGVVHRMEVREGDFHAIENPPDIFEFFDEHLK